MSIELIKGVLRIEELRGKEETQALIEKEIYLSPSKPDIGKILWTDGTAEILTLKVVKDNLIVSGVVKFKVIYKSSDEEYNIHTMEGNTDFREEIEILGITEEMSAFAKPFSSKMRYTFFTPGFVVFSGLSENFIVGTRLPPSGLFRAASL